MTSDCNEEDPLTCPLHVGDLVRVSEEGRRSSKRLKDREGNLGRIKSIKENTDHGSAAPTTTTFLYDVEWVLGGRLLGVRRQDLVRRTAVQEGYTEQRKRSKPTLLLEPSATTNTTSNKASSSSAKTTSNMTTSTAKAATTSKKTPGIKAVKGVGGSNASNTVKSAPAKSIKAAAKPKIKKSASKTKATKVKQSASASSHQAAVATTSTATKTAGKKRRRSTSSSASAEKQEQSSENEHRPKSDAPANTVPNTPQIDLFERHKREFERILTRLEKVDKFGFFLDPAPPEFDECYHGEPSSNDSPPVGEHPDDNAGNPSIKTPLKTKTSEEGGSPSASSVLVETVTASSATPLDFLAAAAEAAETTDDKKNVNDNSGSSTTDTATTDDEIAKPQSTPPSTPLSSTSKNSPPRRVGFPSHAPFNWEMIRRRMEHGRYVLDREAAAMQAIQQRRESLSTSTAANVRRQQEAPPSPPLVLYKQGVNWELFRDDVYAMCDAALDRDDGEELVSPAQAGRGSLAYAVKLIKDTMKRNYEHTGCRQMTELSHADDGHRFYSALKMYTNTEAAMQTWRQTPFPERRYERLSSDVVCAGLSSVDERIALYELRTNLPDSFVGLSYRYDDTGQSEAWMKSVVDETGGGGSASKSGKAAKNGRKSNSSSADDDAREAALAMAADNGVIRAQVNASMQSLLIAVQDRVMTETGVLKQPELKSANWIREQCHECSDSRPEVVEKPVWGIDCYTRRNILTCLGTDFDSDIALLFVEKWLLPAINACPDSLAHDIANAARLLEGLPFNQDAELEVDQASTPVDTATEKSHALLRAALIEKIRTSAPPWLKDAANQLRRARESLGPDFFRVHPKGHGSVLLCQAVGANSLITFYRGEVYPSWRWGEKMDAIGITQDRKDLKPALPDFYNMALERPQSDPRGYGLLFVDASRKAGHGSSLSHSCDPTCEVRVAAVNGDLCLAMTTLRELEMGEELTFDYNAVTESLNEYRSAVCLCGQGKCRGSFLHFATADCYQQVLNRNAPIASRFANLVKGSMKKVMSEEDERVLRSHGFHTAAFGAISVNRRQGSGVDGMECDSLDFVPVWLRTFVADTLRYIEYERRALPIALICDHLSSVKESEEDSGNHDRPVREPKPEPFFFYFSRTQTDLLNSLMKKAGIPDSLTGMQRRQASLKVASSYWQTLSTEEKEYWKNQAAADFERRQKAWKAQDSKSGKPPPSAKGNKKTKNKEPRINDVLLSSKFSFQDADAEGISAMEQRIQQLSQSLSRVGRVLDRHREWSFEHDPLQTGDRRNDAHSLRARVHSPISVLTDDVVIGWIWNSKVGIVQSLIESATISRWARPVLSEKLLIVRSKYCDLESFGDPTATVFANTDEAAGIGHLTARESLRQALLEIRAVLLQEVKDMWKIFREYKVLLRQESDKSIGNEVVESHDGENEDDKVIEDDNLESLALDHENHENAELPVMKSGRIVKVVSGSETVHSLVTDVVNELISEVDQRTAESGIPRQQLEQMSSEKANASGAPASNAQSLFKANPWLEHFNERFVLQVAADLILFYAHTTNFFRMKPYKALTSTPIEVYARELGNTVPRTAMDCDSSEPRSKNSTNVVSGVAKVEVMSRRSPKSSTLEICEPDDIIANVSVSYNGDYVLSQLLQWYNGGIGLKPGLPDMIGCATLPTLNECLCSELVETNRVKADRRTTYETKTRPRLIEWLQDPYQRGGPWPMEIQKAFLKKANDNLANDTSCIWLPFGSPILDFLVTGDESNIQALLSELDGDDKVASKASSDGLLLSVDKGRPAQAVSNWVQCENPDCLKWRKIPWHVDIDLLPEKFFCKDNKWDQRVNFCEAPEDDWDEDDKLVGDDGKVEGSPVRKDPNATLSPADESNFFLGARFDVLRKGRNKFTIGSVIKVDLSGRVKRVKFRFHRCKADADEWIELGSPRIAPLFSKVPKNKGVIKTSSINQPVDSSTTTMSNGAMPSHPKSGNSKSKASSKKTKVAITKGSNNTKVLLPIDQEDSEPAETANEVLVIEKTRVLVKKKSSKAMKSTSKAKVVSASVPQNKSAKRVDEFHNDIGTTKVDSNGLKGVKVEVPTALVYEHIATGGYTTLQDESIAGDFSNANLHNQVKRSNGVSRKGCKRESRPNLVKEAKRRKKAKGVQLGRCSPGDAATCQVVTSQKATPADTDDALSAMMSLANGSASTSNVAQNSWGAASVEVNRSFATEGEVRLETHNVTSSTAYAAKAWKIPVTSLAGYTPSDINLKDFLSETPFSDGSLGWSKTLSATALPGSVQLQQLFGQKDEEDFHEKLLVAGHGVSTSPLLRATMLLDPKPHSVSSAPGTSPEGMEHLLLLASASGDRQQKGDVPASNAARPSSAGDEPYERGFLARHFKPAADVATDTSKVDAALPQGVEWSQREILQGREFSTSDTCQRTFTSDYPLNSERSSGVRSENPSRNLSTLGDFVQRQQFSDQQSRNLSTSDPIWQEQQPRQLQNRDLWSREQERHEHEGRYWSSLEAVVNMHQQHGYHQIRDLQPECVMHEQHQNELLSETVFAQPASAEWHRQMAVPEQLCNGRNPTIGNPDLDPSRTLHAPASVYSTQQSQDSHALAHALRLLHHPHINANQDSSLYKRGF